MLRGAVSIFFIFVFITGVESDFCVKNATVSTCSDYRYPDAVASSEVQMMCGMMPNMPSCTLRSLCQTTERDDIKSSLFCEPFSLLKESCLDMPRMGGCHNYTSLCASGSVVEECSTNVVHLPSSKRARNLTLTMCSEMPMDGCERCINATSGCDWLTVYSNLCISMPDMERCTAWKQMCLSIPSWPLCKGSSSPSGDTQAPAEMRMYFHLDYRDYILFRQWVARTDLQYALSLIAVFAIAVTFEFLKMMRAQLERRWMNEHVTGCTSVNDSIAESTPPFKLSVDVPRSILHFVGVMWGLFVMLIAMTYNVGMVISVGAGAGFGALLFGSIGSNQSDFLSWRRIALALHTGSISRARRNSWRGETRILSISQQPPRLTRGFASDLIPATRRVNMAISQNLVMCLVLSGSVFIFLTAFIAAQGQVNKQYGFTALTILYAVFAAGAPLAGPIVSRFPARYLMFAGALCFATFNIVNIKSIWGQSPIPLFIGGAIDGAGSAIFWVAQGVYINRISDDTNRALFASIFVVGLAGAHTGGNLITYLLQQVPNFSWDLLFSVCSLAGILSAIPLLALKVPGDDASSQKQEAEVETALSSIKNCFSMLKDSSFLILMPSVIAYAFNLSFMFGAFPTKINNPISSSLYLTLFGLSYLAFSLTTGKIAPLLRGNALVLISASGMLLGITLATVAPYTANPAACNIAAAISFGPVEPCYFVSFYSILGNDYSSKLGHANAAFRFVHGLCMGVMFFLSSVMQYNHLVALCSTMQVIGLSLFLYRNLRTTTVNPTGEYKLMAPETSVEMTSNGSSA
ncbi:endosomal membrane protein [Planoprotostelium fungivorum]|uniref:UNC93-like protein MFSD11 n=1 Tax=Planoprotostelium fungivorum TaxID=1890364 RepID=A0A2P6N736_9EUKA|nr:endosomal membrane protein [Planoprotostelium fungivorum]